MKIFATSDVHGSRPIMDKLKTMAPDVDLILICGDIGGKRRTPPQITDADYLVSVLNEIETKSRFILGNDDWFEYEDPHYLQKPEGALIPFEFVLHTPFYTNREANENKLEYELNKLKADRSSIIVAHTPPYRTGDLLWNGKHCGSVSVLRWIQEVQPLIWFCGHIHEDNSVSRIGSTLVFNCSSSPEEDILKGWIVDTNTLEYNKVVL